MVVKYKSSHQALLMEAKVPFWAQTMLVKVHNILLNRTVSQMVAKVQYSHKDSQMVAKVKSLHQAVQVQPRHGHLQELERLHRLADRAALRA
jgi:hypothetical protein